MRLTHIPVSIDSLDLLITSVSADGRWRVIALTNNYSKTPTTLDDFDSSLAAKYPGLTLEGELKYLGWDKGAVTTELRMLFDDFVDSSEVGMRYLSLLFLASAT
jgi:hypothetical protein